MDHRWHKQGGKVAMDLTLTKDLLEKTEKRLDEEVARAI